MWWWQSQECGGAFSFARSVPVELGAEYWSSDEAGRIPAKPKAATPAPCRKVLRPILRLLKVPSREGFLNCRFSHKIRQIGPNCLCFLLAGIVTPLCRIGDEKISGTGVPIAEQIFEKLHASPLRYTLRLSRRSAAVVSGESDRQNRFENCLRSGNISNSLSMNWTVCWLLACGNCNPPANG
jgi:hypothetical protein